MASAARDRLGRTLRGGAQAAFCVELTARTDDLTSGPPPQLLRVAPGSSADSASAGLRSLPRRFSTRPAPERGAAR
jgi:hypothetical protein